MKLKDVEYRLECLPEDMPIKGNCSAIDEKTDKQTEDWIIDQLNSGNEWAWCCVKVTARAMGFEGVDYLGGCSYRSEADFKSGGYFEDMKAQALEDLKRVIADTKARLVCATPAPSPDSVKALTPERTK